jgi:hypothetical protein
MTGWSLYCPKNCEGPKKCRKSTTPDGKSVVIEGVRKRAAISLRALEKYVLTHALRAFHNHAVLIFAMENDPCSTEIASSAQQQASELWQGACVALYRLGDRFLFDLGRTF